MIYVLIVLLVIAVGVIGFLIRESIDRENAADALLRVETAKAVQAQRAREDAAGVAEAAAQERPKRKRRKKT